MTLLLMLALTADPPPVTAGPGQAASANAASFAANPPADLWAPQIEPRRVVYNADAATREGKTRPLAYFVYDTLETGQVPNATARPAIVFFHGGAWIGGKPEQFQEQSRHLAVLGMVAITVEYRLKSTDGVLAVDCVRDAWQAWDHVVDHADELGIDRDRIAIGGGSAGGHIAACLGTGTIPPQTPGADGSDLTDVRPAVMVLFNPGLCFAPFEGYKPTSFENGTVERMGIAPKQLSPMHHLDAATPPTLIMHGTADDVISVRSPSLFVERLQQYGTRAELKRYPGQKHGFFNIGRQGNEPFYRTRGQMTEFLTSLGYLPAA